VLSASTTHRPPAVSFEFFPPQGPEGQIKLDRVAQDLAGLAPQFMSVTYGAGGTTQNRTIGCVERLASKTGVPIASHLTCVGHSRDEVDAIARALWAKGIRRIVALRGDLPDMKGGYSPDPKGYAYAADLVAGLRRIADFDISVGAYPEVHPEAASAERDLDNLKRKLDAGAARAITQYFFDVDCFLRFRDRAAAAGIGKQIVPGILPVHDLAKVIRFSEACGASVPAWLIKLFDGLDEQPRSKEMIAASLGIEMARRLVAEGCDQLHFYSLNRAALTQAICHALGLREAEETVAA